MLGSALGTLRHSLALGQGPKTAALLLLPFLFLPLRSRWIIPAALLLAIRLASANPAYWGLAYHYNSILCTLLAFAALDAAAVVFAPDRSAVRSAAGRIWLEKLLPVALTSAVLAVVLLGPARQFLRPSFYACDRCAARAAMVAAVPDHQPVAADNAVVAALVDHHLTMLAAPDLLDSTGTTMTPPWVLLDRRSAVRPDDPSWASKLENELVASGHYRRWTERDGYVLLHRVR